MVDHALRGARIRNRAIENAGQIVAWSQAFTMGKPRYGVEQLRAQLEWER